MDEEDRSGEFRKREIALYGMPGRKECPRGYCYYWHYTYMYFEIPVSEGCRYMHFSRKYPDMHQNGDKECKRLDPNSSVDHFEESSTYLEDDGIAKDYFRPANE